MLRQIRRRVTLVTLFFRGMKEERVVTTFFFKYEISGVCFRSEEYYLLPVLLIRSSFLPTCLLIALIQVVNTHLTLYISES